MPGKIGRVRNAPVRDSKRATCRQQEAEDRKGSAAQTVMSAEQLLGPEEGMQAIVRPDFSLLAREQFLRAGM
jgi:hypothetical protein